MPGRLWWHDLGRFGLYGNDLSLQKSATFLFVPLGAVELATLAIPGDTVALDGAQVGARRVHPLPGEADDTRLDDDAAAGPRHRPTASRRAPPRPSPAPDLRATQPPSRLTAAST